MRLAWLMEKLHECSVVVSGKVITPSELHLGRESYIEYLRVVHETRPEEKEAEYRFQGCSVRYNPDLAVDSVVFLVVTGNFKLPIGGEI